MKSQEELFDDIYFQLNDLKDKTILKNIGSKGPLWLKVSIPFVKIGKINLNLLENYNLVKVIDKKETIEIINFSDQSLKIVSFDYVIEINPIFDDFLKEFEIKRNNFFLTIEERFVDIKELFEKYQLIETKNIETEKNILKLKNISYDYSKSLLKIDNFDFYINLNEDSMKLLLFILEAKGTTVIYNDAFIEIYKSGTEILSDKEIRKIINNLKQRIKHQLLKYSINKDQALDVIKKLLSRIKCEKNIGYKLIDL
jgi:hypothetical protein